MKYILKTRTSASALAKLLGIDYSSIKEFKQLLESSSLETKDESYTTKNKTIEYVSYDIKEALDYCYLNIKEEVEETTVILDIEKM